MVTEAIRLEDFFSSIFETRGRFPRCFVDRVAFPFDVILISSASSAVIEDSLDFPSFFVIVDLGRWSDKVRAVSFCFGVG